MRFCAPYHRFDANQALKGDVWFGSLADIGERIKDVRRPAPGSPFLLLHFGHFTFVASCSVIALERLAAFFATILVGRHVNTRDQMVLGAWKGGAYTDDKTGAFSHCAASTPYVSGIYFVVSVTRLMTWNLGFAHPAWNLREGESIPIALTFDGRFNFNVVGSALRVGNKTNLVIVPMPDNSALIDAFRRAYVMKAYAKGREFGFNLTTTALLLPALVECVRANQNMSSFNTGQPEVPLSPELQMEAVQSATNFILKSGLQNPRVLSRAETPAEFASFGAAWTSDEAVGAVKIVPPDPNYKGLRRGRCYSRCGRERVQRKIRVGPSQRVGRQRGRL
jgi:hypothetical protein